MAIAKLKPIRMKKRGNQAKSSMQQPAKSKILRKSKVRQPKFRLKQLKPKHRSLLMRNALLPILETLPQGKSKLAKSRMGVAKSKHSKAAAPAAAAKATAASTNKKRTKKQPNNRPNESAVLRKNRTRSPPLCTAVGVGVGAFNEMGLQAGKPRRQAPRVSAQNLLPLMGSGIQKPAYRSFGINGPTAPKPIPRNAEIEVPLATRLPIIDFISTDEFERLHIAKKKFNKRL